MLLFTFQFFSAITSTIYFWGIAYLLIVRRKKVPVRNAVALAHFAVTSVILALAFSPARQMTEDESSNFVLAAIVLSVISCTILRWQEQKYQKSKKHEVPKGE